MAKGKAVRLGYVGSAVFGIVLFFVGYFFRNYLGGESSPLNSGDAKTCAIAGLVVMIVGGAIAIGYIALMLTALFYVITKR